MVLLLFAATCIPSHAQIFTTLANFNSTGRAPSSVNYSPLVQGTDGNLYGTTAGGGVGGGFGTVFKITPGGTLTTLHSFSGTDGANPSGALVQGTDGNYYGTTVSGGVPYNVGTIFKITPGGTLTTLHSFSGTDGANPSGALVQGTDGNFYGITTSGTVFEMTPSGLLTTLYTSLSLFGGGSLVQGTDGNFYGTSLRGTVFKITPSGVLTTLHTFGGTDGNSPFGTLIQATDGNFYGTTELGGAYGDGTVFKITLSGVLTTLHNFVLNDEGGDPCEGLVQGTDGNLYGTTIVGGANNLGTIFRLTLPPMILPAPTITGIVNDAGFTAGAVSTGSWAAIFGTNLAPAGDSRTWNAATEIVKGTLPTQLDGTSVKVNGLLAAVEFISPSQVNIQPPEENNASGPMQVVVTTAGGESNSFTVNYAGFAPGLFPAASPYLVAQHADNRYVTAASPAAPGEVIVLWGTGFGPANPAVPAGKVFSGANPLANAVTVTIGGQPATVDFAGVVGAGLVQINVEVPSSISNGDAGVVATVGGVSTQTTGNMISIHN